MKHFPVVLGALLLFLMGILAGGAAFRESITVDEVAHISAGVSYPGRIAELLNVTPAARRTTELSGRELVRADDMVTLWRTQIAGFHSAEIDNYFLKHDTGIHYPKFQGVIAGIGDVMDRTYFANAVLYGSRPRLWVVVGEYIYNLRRFVVEGHGITEAAARDEIQRGIKNCFHSNGARVEKVHSVFKAGRMLPGQQALCCHREHSHG